MYTVPVPRLVYVSDRVGPGHSLLMSSTPIIERLFFIVLQFIDQGIATHVFRFENTFVATNTAMSSFAINSIDPSNCSFQNNPDDTVSSSWLAIFHIFFFV